jgi:hypothetical protein
VGCIPDVVTPPVDEEEEEEEEEEEVVTATVAPVILTVVGLTLTATATQYINATEAALVVVTGTAPTYSEVKIYVDDVCAGTANVGDTGTFSVTVAEADLGADGDKVIYATAKEAAIDVSAHSTEYAFVLDQVAPGIDSVAFTANADSSIDSALVSGVSPISTSAIVGGTGTLAAGTWTITCLGDSGDVSNIIVSDGTTSTTYTIAPADVANLGIIPGVNFTLAGAFAAGDVGTITTTIVTVGRATIKFNEDVDYTGMAAGTYAGGLVAVDPTTYKAAVDTGYWTGLTIVAYTTYTITTYGITDLAGNVGGTSAIPLAKSAVASVASATALAP